MNKLILNFKSKESKKIKNPKNFLGGKGANLSEMGKMGLPVPPGFTISTEVCEIFYKNKKKLNSKLINQIKKELKFIEKDVSKKFGDLKNPLLLSVRSGARVSMPGMMDTILNLGLNDKTVWGGKDKEKYANHNFKERLCFADVDININEIPKLSNQVFLNYKLNTWNENTWQNTFQLTKNRYNQAIIRGYVLNNSNIWNDAINSKCNILSTNKICHHEWSLIGNTPFVKI